MKVLSGKDIAQRAKEQLADLTDLKPDTVSSMAKGPDGWHVNVEMVELKRIPDSTDVLACYECILDDDAVMISYKRTRRYYREETN